MSETKKPKKSLAVNADMGTARMREPRAPVPRYSESPPAPTPEERKHGDQALSRIRDLLKGRKKD
jgi:hypothetical protein